ncbi:hypothetical protein PEPS_18500 [Persicobacter psychrovividus]|uniref:ABC transporter permease n=1 Tax=Persicobacter psychrovividus TaxID=387638 RepID=A0ABM7VF78_9BACT|nr:hypothetical protein PEPS_18500 [Persicobacter psychrovividus]
MSQNTKHVLKTIPKSIRTKVNWWLFGIVPWFAWGVLMVLILSQFDGYGL